MGSDAPGEAGASSRGPGIHIRWLGRSVALKWHRARKVPADTAFTAVRIVEGLGLGASVEVDINRHAGGGFAVLHDDTLDRETTGGGRVGAADAETLRRLTLRDNVGRPTDDPVMVLDDLADLIRAHGHDPKALLQLDMKTPAGDLTERDIGAFASAVGRMGVQVVLSSGDAGAVRIMAAAAPGVIVGYDPCDDRRLLRLCETGAYGQFVSEVITESPGAEIIYLAIPLILAVDAEGFDLIGAFQRAGKRVDAWTMETADDAQAPVLRRLLDLKVDQITTDDPVGLERLAQALR